MKNFQKLPKIVQLLFSKIKSWKLVELVFKEENIVNLINIHLFSLTGCFLRCHCCCLLSSSFAWNWENTRIRRNCSWKTWHHCWRCPKLLLWPNIFGWTVSFDFENFYTKIYWIFYLSFVATTQALTHTLHSDQSLYHMHTPLWHTHTLTHHWLTHVYWPGKLVL